MTQNYIQSLELALKPACGEHALDQNTLDQNIALLAPSLEKLRQAHEDGVLAFMRAPSRRDDLDEIERAVNALRAGARDIVIFGTGGSSLGGQTLAQLGGWQVPGFDVGALDDGFRVHFFDNLDAQSMTSLLRKLDLATSRFIVISKSGNTPETLMQMLVTIEALREAGLDWNIAQHFLSVTAPALDGDNNALRELAQFYKIPILDHHASIGGRYSVFTNVGMIIAYLLDLDPIALREGAQSVIDPLLEQVSPHEYAPAIGAGLQYSYTQSHEISMSVLMPYSAQMRAFSAWYVQLWSESLGKSGKGITPIAASGPVDQHSQLQLYLDGPADKVFTIIMTETSAQGPTVPQTLARNPNLGYLAGKTIGDLIDSQQRATANTLADNGRPVRILEIAALGERTMGALLMHFMIETILMADLLGVDPFDQPAVEQGKILTRQYLGDD